MTGAPSGEPSGANRETVRGSNDGERVHVERRSLHELAEAAAQDGAPFGRDADRHAGPRRPVHALDDRVTIQPQPELERHPRSDAPAVLREHGELEAADLLLGAAAEHGQLGERAVEAADLERAGSR